MTFAAHTFLGTAGSGGGGGGTTKYSGTITCGYNATGFPAFIDGYGFDTGFFFGIGSRSPTTVSGHTFATLADYYSAGSYASSYLLITGFGADPLTGFITSVTANGVTLSPTSYSYGTGTAQWNFTTAGGFSFPSSGTVAVAMIGS